MASPARRLSLGPWEQGLVLVPPDQRDVSTQQALERCINLDVNDDGFLVSRAGCQRVYGTRPTAISMYAPTSRECRVLGSVYEGGDLCAVLGVVDKTAHNTYIYVTADGYTLYYWGVINEHVSSVQQYNGFIYIISSETSAGAKPGFAGYKITANFFSAGLGSSSNAATAVGTIPTGEKSFIFKDRLFVVSKSTSTMWYSVPTDPTDYTSTNGGGYFIVAPANDLGTYINDVVIAYETFYIFKRDQTYLFAYDSDPGNDGVLKLINSALGAFSASVYENDIYLINTKGVYRIVNGIFVQVDAQLDLAANADLASIIDPQSLTAPIFCHVDGNKLLVGPLSDYVYTTFGFRYASMNLRNGAWSSYNYRDDTLAPGGQGTTAQKSGKWGVEIYPSKGLQTFCRIAKTYGPTDYGLDGSNTASDPQLNKWLPPFQLRLFPYNADDAGQWKKIHRLLVRGKWLVQTGTTVGDANIKLTYDDNATLQDFARWNANSWWELERDQSEAKISIKQARFRNLVLEITSVGETAANGHNTTEPPNGSKADPASYFYLTNVAVELSLPRGNSSN